MKVLVTPRLPAAAFATLDDVEFLPASPLGRLVGRARPGVEALVVAGEVVDREVLRLLPDLGLVATCSVGYDHISVPDCVARGICVAYTPGVVDAATAELTFALLLALHRRIPQADRFVREGLWPTSTTGDLFGNDLSGSTLGIIGLGRIGTAVARRARAFDMRVVYTGRARRPPELEHELGVEHRSLAELLGEVNAVTVHCPLNQETSALLDADRLGLLRDGASVVNTARGGIIDEQALVRELESGRLQAGLDVFVHEPNLPPRLLELKNVVLTPHVGTLTYETRAAMVDLVVRNVEAFAARLPLPTPIPGGL